MEKKSFIGYLKITLLVIYVLSLGLFIWKRNFLGISMGIFGIATVMILGYINKRMPNLVDRNLFVVLNLFVFFASLLGSSFNFYDIPHYDDFLHVWSGFIAVAAGFSILKALNPTTKFTPLFTIVFLVMFSLGVGATWEMVEFFMDTFAHTNMQVGGLLDTMIDMLDGLAGTIVMVIILWIKKDIRS